MGYGTALRRWPRLGAELAAVMIGIATLASCATCSRIDDDDLETWVDALIADSGSLADQAADVLASRGRDSIVILETGLYRAEPRGRRRIIDVLGRIGHRDAIPVLAHLAQFDPDDTVRDRAAAVLRRWSGTRARAPDAPEAQRVTGDAQEPRRAEESGNVEDSRAPEAPCTTELTRTSLAPGLVVERKQPAQAPGLPTRDRCLVLVRFDPARFDLKLLTSSMESARTPDDWSRDFGLIGVINAAMFAPSGRPTGLTIAGGKTVYARNHASHSAFLAFGPRRPGLPAVRLVGRDCPGFDLSGLRRDYANIIQNDRLLGCNGEPLPWKDPKPYSAAAVALDRAGRVVFIHSVAAYPMTEFARILADDELGLVAAMYVEGGVPAQLFVHHGETRIERAGAYEALLFRRGGSPSKLPNVLGFTAR